ncbi:hypothetical protein [Polaromonas sp. YR568]|uniref:hypothetical protein n=1 Tax=Polaromonas sp. YR568 TaxID=1855301 RepID=UPI00398C11BC
MQYTGACQCGAGTFSIDECTPDHSWPTSRPLWYEPHINCTACANQFEIEQRSGDFVLVEKTRLEEQEQKRHAARTALEAAEGHASVIEVKKIAAGLLDNAGSVSAAHRLATQHNLDDSTIGTFRRHWRGGEVFMRGLRLSALKSAFTWVGVDSKDFDQLIEEYRRLDEDATRPPQAFAAPFHRLKRNRF